MRHSHHKSHDSTWHRHDDRHSHREESQWEEPIYNYEGELAAEKGYALFTDVSSKLQKKGEIKLNDHNIKPTDPAYFGIHHEETDEGYHKLTCLLYTSPSPRD